MQEIFFLFQATLQDLEQRRPQLEELITAAQNLKNKTSNQEARTIITDRSKSLNGSGYIKARYMKYSVKYRKCKIFVYDNYFTEEYF